MSSIQYRPIEPKDYEAVSEIIGQSFGFAAYVADASVLAAFKKQYLYSCLAEATYTCVTEQQGVVVGIIMGKADSQYCFFPHVPAFINLLWYSLKMWWLAGKRKIAFTDYQTIHKIYRRFDCKHAGEFDGVLTLFAVTKESRGLGIGKHLWHGLQEYLQKQRVQKIYLYTDSACNTGFYDSQNFQRMEEEKTTVIRGNQKAEMTIYLYGREIEKNERHV